MSWLYSGGMRALLVYNPAAGQRDATTDLEKAASILTSHGWQVEVRHTHGHDDATRIAKQAAEAGYEMVVAAGGDGTVGQVASGLAESDTLLGVLPVGTGNVWARNLGIPFWTPTSRSALLDAAAILVDGAIHEVDLGKVGDRYFILHSGIGLDAQITQGVEPRREALRNLRNVGYVVTTISTALGLRGTRMTITIDGRTIRERVIMILACNAQYYAGSFCVAPMARLDDGMLDVYVFKGGNTFDTFSHIVKLLLGRHARDPKVQVYRAREIEIRSDKPLPVQTDGDPVGMTPVSISVAPKAIKVIVPRSAPVSLFQDSATTPTTRNALLDSSP